jgi:parallel beta-helix repeat protein
MFKRAFILFAIIVFGTAVPVFMSRAVAAASTLRVPTEFPTIQAALDSASPGDTIFVYNGTYHERILVDKTLTVVGQSSETTTISGDDLGTAVNITSSGVSFSNFTITNGGPSLLAGGISLDLVSGCLIFGNNVMNNSIGLLVSNASGNRIFHNNFISNVVEVATSNSTNFWDNGYPSGGNYWSDYAGADVKRGPFQDQSGSDGIIDSPYSVDTDTVDRYPFVSYWRPRVVRNVDTGISYETVQGAIDAPQTLSGNVIMVYNGVFYENVVLNKHLHLVGASLDSIIDGGGVGSVVQIVSDSASVSSLTLRRSGSNPSDSAVLVNGVSSASISGSVLANSSVGINLNNSYSCTVQGNNVSYDVVGVKMEYSQDNALQANDITNLADVGVWLRYSNSNIVDGNRVHLLRDGVRIENSFSNLFRQNFVSDIGSYALHVMSSGRNEFSGNTITNGYIGLLLESSPENMIAGNEVSNNRVGVYLISSFNNTVYYNNFVGNVFQAIIDSASGLNKWSMSYPIGGNYWKGAVTNGTYSGVDMKRGPYQNETGSDGIGDTLFMPDTASPANNDYYPQMHAVNLTAAVDIHDVCVKSIFIASNKIYRGGLLNVTVLVSNVGNYTELLNVTAHYSASVIATQGIFNLLPRSELNVTFAWNTTGLDTGTYTLSANVTAVPGEKNLGDNQFVGGNVSVGFYRDIAVSSAGVSSTIAYSGKLINVTAIVSNLGEIPENLTVSAAYDGNLIATRTVNALATHANASVTFTWNTSGLSLYHNYNITVKVDLVPDEAASGNNILSAGLVNARLMGDINGDRIVNIVDISAVAIHFSSKIGDSRYDPAFDLNSDGTINIVDITMVAVNFLRTA